MTQTETPSRSLQLLVLIVGIFAISSGSIFIRLAQGEAVPSLVIAAWRTGLSALILLPFAATRRRAELRHMGRSRWLLAIASGVMLGIHFATWISSLALTSITSSTVLVSTAPLWVGLASPLVLNESLTRGLKQGIALALVGTVVVSLGDVVVFGDGGVALDLAAVTGDSRALLGNLLALTGGIAVAGYLLIGRRLRQELSLLSYTTVVYGMAAVTILLFNLIAGEHLFGYSLVAYVLFVAMALFPQMVGHTSFNWALSFLPAAFVSVAAISEPIGASILAVLVFQEVPGPLVIAGSILILAGVYLASRSTKN